MLSKFANKLRAFIYIILCSHLPFIAVFDVAGFVVADAVDTLLVGGTGCTIVVVAAVAVADIVAAVAVAVIVPVVVAVAECTLFGPLVDDTQLSLSVYVKTKKFKSSILV